MIYFHKHRDNMFAFTKFIIGIAFIILIGEKNRHFLEVKK